MDNSEGPFKARYQPHAVNHFSLSEVATAAQLGMTLLAPTFSTHTHTQAVHNSVPVWTNDGPFYEGKKKKRTCEVYSSDNNTLKLVGKKSTDTPTVNWKFAKKRLSFVVLLIR